MEILLDFCYYVSFFFIPVAIYSIFFRHKRDTRFYTNRDLYYLIKLIYAKPAIRKFQNKYKQSLGDDIKKTLEYPKEIRSDIYSDNNFIYGTDQNGNNLSLRFTVRSGLVADVFICLRLANGAIYTLPGDKIKTYNLASQQWKTKDLSVEILEPFKRLRITYNGLLSNVTQDVEHVQFNFIWVAAGGPQFHPQDASTTLLADALARQQWKNGNWISLLGDERGYEQFGALRGFVKGDSFEDDLFLNLPSCRTRFWGTNEKLAIKKSLRLFVAGKDGALISLWVKNFKKGCSELQYGNVITNNGTVLPITNSDVRLEFLAPPVSTPSMFTVHVYVKNKIYRNVIHINVKKSVTSDYLPELSNMPADCDQNTQQAKALVEFWYTSKKSSISQPPPLLLGNKTQNLPQSYVTAFGEEESKMVKLTGGKGCSLALLTSLKSDDFSVPDGFIVTINAFNKQLEVNFNMRKSVAILDDIWCGRTKGDEEQACIQTVKTFQTEKILPEIKKSIVEALNKVRKDSNIPFDRWAVRSSAIGEDSEELSAAGQNETFLGCTTPDDVVTSVSLCWASLFTYQSVQYRHQHGLPIATQMGVVVQRMVPSDCAGVMFTCHPTTGNPALIVITANHGLGESVVSGRSEPDTVVLERTFDNDVTIKSKSLGTKNKIIKMVDGGVKEEEGVDGFSITDNQALALGRVGVFLEDKFGGSRDVEWGFYQGRLYLLQSRPITTLNIWSNWELSHELDVASLSGDCVYTVANTGEILPGAISVLTSSTIVKCVDDSIKMCMDNGYDVYAFKCLSIFQHHLFVDVVNGIHKRVDEDISLVSRILDLAIFGHPIIDETIHLTARTRYGVATGLDKLQDLVTMIKLAWKNEEIAKRSKKIVAEHNIHIDNRDTLEDIFIKITHSVEKFRDVIFCHSCTTRTSVSYQIFSMVVLAENNYDFTVDHYNDVAMLLASCEDVISAEIPSTIAKITKILIENKQAEEFAKIKPEVGEKWLQSNSPDAAKIFAKFLKDHGHRGLREFDVFNPTWGANPSEVIKIIQTNCKTMSGTKSEKVTKPLDEIIAALVSPKKSSTRKTLKFLMKKSRKAVGLREQTKSEAIKFINKLREAYNTLGLKMALDGLIPDARLIYHLTHYEIGVIITGTERNPVLISKALKRQKLYPKWDMLKFPEISYGLPRHETREFVPRTGKSKVKCEGTPVCAGVVQARACVITDLAEIDQLREGDILITYCTDIAWSPYFPMLGGIVTELGGLVSHGAVIAREYGLPCIVGAKGATKLFKTGDNVVLSGKGGIIELIDN